MASPRIPNLLITRLGLKVLLKKIKYNIIADSKFTVKEINDIEKLNKLAYQIFRQYVELYYKRLLRNYDGNNLTTKVLAADNANMQTEMA